MNNAILDRYIKKYDYKFKLINLNIQEIIKNRVVKIWITIYTEEFFIFIILFKFIVFINSCKEKVF